ncbi:hypothetical protein GIB67_028659 [Kingdonia uniflora]|uniref:Uncharacterized protein n=1 Tax=Kingdonia uniflora TaxID=39325 RepID=A0A7J7L1B9_9MAGN|nr:hypothetical protein GIB67_028659 [Kingdonia uniflora]
MLVLGSLRSLPTLPHISSSSNQTLLTRRKSILLASTFVTSFLNFVPNWNYPSFKFARAEEEDEFLQQEERNITLFQEASPVVVFIKDIELAKNPKRDNVTVGIEDEEAKVEGTGSGFIWDKIGHILCKRASRIGGISVLRLEWDFIFDGSHYYIEILSLMIIIRSIAIKSIARVHFVDKFVKCLMGSGDYSHRGVETLLFSSSSFVKLLF